LAIMRCNRSDENDRRIIVDGDPNRFVVLFDGSNEPLARIVAKPVERILIGRAVLRPRVGHHPRFGLADDSFFLHICRNSDRVMADRGLG